MADALVLVVDATVGPGRGRPGPGGAILRATGKPLFLVANKARPPQPRHAPAASSTGSAWATRSRSRPSHGRGIDDMLAGDRGPSPRRCPRTLDRPSRRYRRRYRGRRPSGTGADTEADHRGRYRDGRSQARRTPRSTTTSRPLGRGGARRRSAFGASRCGWRSSVAPTPASRRWPTACSARSGRWSTIEAGTTTDPVDTPFPGRRSPLHRWSTPPACAGSKAEGRRRRREDRGVDGHRPARARRRRRAGASTARSGPSEQDARLAGMVEHAGRGLVLALNKVDLVRGDAVRAALAQSTEDNFHFLTWAPTHLLSARRGDGVDRLMTWSTRSRARTSAGSRPPSSTDSSTRSSRSRHPRCTADARCACTTSPRGRSDRRRSCSGPTIRTACRRSTAGSSPTSCARATTSAARRSGSWSRPSSSARSMNPRWRPRKRTPSKAATGRQLARANLGGGKPAGARPSKAGKVGPPSSTRGGNRPLGGQKKPQRRV
jgi:hypothetical protein